MATLASLMVQIGADTARLSTDMNKATSMIEGFSRKTQSALKGIAATAIAAFSFGAIVSGMKSAVEAMDKLNESSQKVGVSVETLQVWQLAAKMASVDSQALEKGLGKLAAAAYEQKGAFEELGLKTTDATGNLKSIDALLPEIADKFSKMEDGTKKAALAKELFGKAGMDLIPILNKGAAGLQEISEKMGYIASAEDTARADAFNDTLDMMHARSKSMMTALTSGLLPAMQQITESFGAGANMGQQLRDIGEGIGNVFKFAAGSAYSLIAGVQTLTVRIAALADRAKIGWDAITGNTEGIGDRMRASRAGQLSAETEIMQSYFAKMDKLNANIPVAAGRKRGGGGTPKPDSGGKSAMDQEREAMEAWLLKAKDMDPWLNEFIKKKQDLEAEASKLTRKFGEQKWITEGLSTALKNLDLQKLKKELEEAYEPAKDMADLERVWADAIEERNEALNKDVLEKYKKSITDISEVAEETNGMVKDMAGLFENKMSSMADAITDFCLTGKFEFSNMVNSMMADMMKLYYKQLMFGSGDKGGGIFEKILGGVGGMFASPGSSDMTGGWSGAGGGSQNMIDVFNGPAFASGGIVTTPTIAKVGEAGPEAIIPLSQMSSPHVNVNIINNNGSEVTQKSSANGNGGINLEVMIDAAVGKQIGSRGSQTNRAMRHGFGSRPTLTSR